MNGMDENIVIPAQAGIQWGPARSANPMFVNALLDSRLRGNDGLPSTAHET
jgi:hypothetical protein